MRHAVVTGNLAGTWNFKTIVLNRVSAKSIIHCLVGLFNKRVYPQNWDANWDATSEVLEGSFFSVEIQKNWHSGYRAFAKSCVRLIYMQCRLLAFVEHMGSLLALAHLSRQVLWCFWSIASLALCLLRHFCDMFSVQQAFAMQGLSFAQVS